MVPSLTFLFNSSIKTSIYPSLWKLAYIIPLNKITQPKTPNDTRPIANLSHISKAFVKILSSQIIQYLENNKLLDKYQFGFRRAHSTQSALLNLLEHIRRAIDNKQVVILILFDFSKAFDSLDHKTLLLRLRECGFSDNTIAWVHSYLTGRQQTIVDLNGEPSNYLGTTSGVPQGSSLGPILFLIYINSIVNVIMFCKRGIFADDLQIYLQTSVNDIHESLKKVSADANAVINWARGNGLTPNLMKTKAIIFGSDHYLKILNSLQIYSINIDGSYVPFEQTVKNLGVTLSNNLSWQAHVNSLVRKVNGSLFRLRYHSDILSIELRKTLVQALIIPIVDYCCILMSDITKELDTKIQILINHTIRYIYKLRRDANITQYRLRLSWLDVKSRRDYFITIYFYKLMFIYNPPCFNEFLVVIRRDSEVTEGQDNRIFQSSQNFIVVRRSERISPVGTAELYLPHPSTDYLYYSFFHCALRFWKTLPNNLQNINSLNTFRLQLFNYLLNRN